MNPYLKQYQRTEIETATPEKVLILLYDGAIQFLNKAIIAIDQNNIPEMHNNIMGAEHIILEFINTLDFEQGGDFAIRLNALYQYFYNTLISANLNKDKDKVQEVLTFLIDLRVTWKQAINMTSPQPAEQNEASGDTYVSNSDEEGEYYEEEEGEDNENTSSYEV